MRFNDVVHVSQHGGSALLNIGVSVDVGALLAVGFGQHVAGGNLRCHFVAENVREADGLADVDAVYYPTKTIMKIYAFYHPAGGAGRGNVVADTLNLHFRPGEASVLAPHLHFDGHWFTSSFLLLNQHLPM